MTYHQIPIMKRVMTPQKLVPAQHGLPTVDLALSDVGKSAGSAIPRKRKHESISDTAFVGAIKGARSGVFVQPKVRRPVDSNQDNLLHLQRKRLRQTSYAASLPHQQSPMRVSDFKPIEDLFPPVAADLSPDKALVPSGTGCKVDPISSFYNQVKEPHDVDVTDVIRNTCPHNLIQQSCDRMQCKDRWKCCPAFNNLEPTCPFKGLLHDNLVHVRTTCRGIFNKGCPLGDKCKWGHDHPALRMEVDMMRKAEAKVNVDEDQARNQAALIRGSKKALRREERRH